MKKIHLLIAISTLLTALLLVSCEEIIEYNGPHRNPVLMLQSIQNKDSTIKVNLSQTAFFTDDSDQYFINNAQVEMSLNGAPFETLIKAYTKGYYVSNKKIRANDVLKIRASVPEFETIIAEDKMPIDANFSLKFISAAKDNGEARFELKIQDPKGDNYYLIAVDFVYISQLEYITDTIHMRRFHSSDPIMQGENQFSDEAIPYFTDEAFDGESHTFTIISGDDGDEDISYVGLNYKLKYIIVECSQLSEAAFKYLKSYKQAIRYNNNPLAEPIQIYSNVDNGFGVLGMRNKTLKTLTIE